MGITSRLLERCRSQQARLHALRASVMRRTNHCARAHVKWHVHQRAGTTPAVARTVPQAPASRPTSDCRRPRCSSPAPIGSHGARARHDPGACAGTLAGGAVRAHEALWRVPGARCTAAERACPRSRTVVVTARRGRPLPPRGRLSSRQARVASRQGWGVCLRACLPPPSHPARPLRGCAGSSWSSHIRHRGSREPAMLLTHRDLTTKRSQN